MDSVPTSLAPPAPYHYWAFVSYSHRDQRWANWLHRALELYRVPRRLKGEGLPRRLYPIFKDRDELPVSPDLGHQIETALAQSRHLIVVCSPHSAQSRFVNEEVRQFKAMGGTDRILCLVVDGEPNASDHPGAEASECFVPALRYAVGPDGELTEERAEPIAADLRPGKDGRAYGFLKLLAGLLGVRLDDLARRDHERRVRRLIGLATLMLVVACLFAAVACWAVLATQEAQRGTYRLHCQQAQDLLDRNGEPEAIRHLVEAIRLRPEEPTAGRRLAAALTQNGVALPLGQLAWPKSLGACRDAQFAPDGTRLAGVLGRGVQVWDAQTWQASGAPLVAPPGHQLWCGCFSPDGKRYLAGTDRGLVRIWRVADGAVLRDWQAHDQGVRAIATSPDGRFIATGGERHATIWMAGSGSLAARLPHDDQDHLAVVICLAFSHDSARLATGTWGGEVRLWSPDTGAHQLTYRPGPQATPIQALAFSPQRGWLARASDDIRVWDPAKQALVAQFASSAATQIQSLEFAGGDRYLFTGGSDRTARFWDVGTGRLAPVLPVAHRGQVAAARYQSRYHRLVTVADGGLQVWDAHNAASVAYPLEVRRDLSKQLTVSADGSHGAVTRWTEPHVLVYDVSTAAGSPVTVAHNRCPKWITLSRDGRRLVTVASGGRCQVWDTQTGAAVSPPIDLQTRVNYAELSSDDKVLLTAGVDANQAVRLWDVATGRALAGGPQRAGDVLFATGADETDPELRRRGCYADCATRSPDGRWLAVTAAEQVQVYATDGWRRQWSTPSAGHADVPCAAFSPDSTLLGLGFGDGTVRLVRAHDGQRVGPVLQLGLPVDQVGFSPDGRLLAAHTRTGAARYWSLATATEVCAPLLVPGIAFGRDGRAVAWPASDSATDVGLQLGPPPSWLVLLATALVRDDSYSRSPDLTVWARLSPAARRWARDERDARDLLYGKHGAAGLLDTVRARLANSPPTDPWVRWGRWFLADRDTRTISPFSAMTRPEYDQLMQARAAAQRAAPTTAQPETRSD